MRNALIQTFTEEEQTWEPGFIATFKNIALADRQTARAGASPKHAGMGAMTTCSSDAAVALPAPRKTH